VIRSKINTEFPSAREPPSPAAHRAFGFKNARGVVLVLRGRTIGLELNVSVSGVEISLR
jgi:hypothetical protein